MERSAKISFHEGQQGNNVGHPEEPDGHGGDVEEVEVSRRVGGDGEVGEPRVHDVVGDGGGERGGGEE